MNDEGVPEAVVRDLLDSSGFRFTGETTETVVVTIYRERNGDSYVVTITVK